MVNWRNWKFCRVDYCTRWFLTFLYCKWSRMLYNVEGNRWNFNKHFNTTVKLLWKTIHVVALQLKCAMSIIDFLRFLCCCDRLEESYLLVRPFLKSLPFVKIWRVITCAISNNFLKCRLLECNTSGTWLTSSAHLQ